MGFADNEKNKSNSNLISDLKNKFAKSLDDNVEKKIKEEQDVYNNSNISQNDFIARLEQQKQEAEQNQEQDKANMYAMAIAFLKDLWAKKMSEAEQKKLQYVVEQKAKIELQKYLEMPAQQKQQEVARTLIENLKRKEVMENAKKIAKENPELVEASKKAFGMTGNNIVNQFSFQNAQQQDGFLMRR